MLIEELVMLSYIGSMPADKPRVDDLELIEDLLVAANGLRDFVQGLCDVAAQVASRETGIAVDCGISLSRPKRPSAVAGSTTIAAQLMDGEHDTLDEGPCLEAGATGSRVLVGADAMEQRWPLHSKTLAFAGYANALLVPFAFRDGACALMVFLAATPGAFTEDATPVIDRFNHTAHQALQIALKTAAGSDLISDLHAAMRSRSVIDTACGMIMMQERCTQEEAFRTLQRASSARNKKLRLVAEEILRRANSSAVRCRESGVGSSRT